MRFRFFVISAALVIFFASESKSQDIGLQLQELESQATQDFRITWAPRLSGSAKQKETMAVISKKISEFAAYVHVDQGQCHDNELQADDFAVFQRADALMDAYNEGSKGNTAHAAELGEQYNSAEGFNRQMTIYEALISAKGRAEMYDIMLPPMKDDIDISLSVVNNACLIRRIRKAVPDFDALNASDLEKANDLARSLFMDDAKIFDVTISYISAFKL